METKEFNKRMRQMLLKQQYNESHMAHVKDNIKSLAKISLDTLNDMPDDIELQEIAVSSDFALLLMESLEDAIQHISNKLKLIHTKRMNEQTKSKENGNNDNGTEAAGQGEPQA